MLGSLDSSSNAVPPRPEIGHWVTVTVRDHPTTHASDVNRVQFALSKRSSSSGLTPGQIGGILAGSFVFCIIVILLWAYVSGAAPFRRFGRRSRSPSPPPSPPPPPPPNPPRGPGRLGPGRNTGRGPAPIAVPVPPPPAHGGDKGPGRANRPVELLSDGYYRDPERGRPAGWARPKFRRNDEEEDKGGPVLQWNKRSRGKSRPQRVQVVEPD